MFRSRSVETSIRAATSRYVQMNGQDVWFNPFDIARYYAQSNGFKSRTPKSMKNVTRSTPVVMGPKGFILEYGDFTDTLRQAASEGTIREREIDTRMMPWYRGWERNIPVESSDQWHYAPMDDSTVWPPERGR